MPWESISSAGRVKLARIDGALQSNPDGKVVRGFARLETGVDLIFQQDNNPKYATRATIK